MTVTVLQPSAGIDTRLSSAGAQASDNYGTTTTMAAGNSSTNPNRSLIKFDLSALPAGITITSATLSLFCTSQISGIDYNVALHRSLVQWYEGSQNSSPPTAGQDGSTWNLRNANGSVAWAGGAGGASGSDWFATATDTELITGTGIFFNWDVSVDIQNFVDGVYTNNGWWILGEAVTDSSKSFATSDNVTAANRPTLIVDWYIPETDMFGSSSGTSIVTGVMHATGRLAGLASGSATATATLISNQIAGVISGTSIVTGILKATTTMEGSTSGTSTATGVLRGRTHMLGAISGTSTITADGGFTGQLRGAIFGTSTAQATGWAAAMHVIRARGCYEEPLLYITNGTVKNNGQLNLLNLIDPKIGYLLNTWRPAISQYKEGGTFSDSPHGTGRRLVRRVFANSIEIFDLKARSHSQDDLIEYTHELLNWQEGAADFWTSDWANVPIYIVAKAARETNPRYAIIHMISVPELENPYSQPFYTSGRAAHEQLTLRVERGEWTSNPPGQYTCVPISSIRSWTVAGWVGP